MSVFNMMLGGGGGGGEGWKTAVGVIAGELFTSQTLTFAVEHEPAEYFCCEAISDIHRTSNTVITHILNTNGTGGMKACSVSTTKFNYDDASLVNVSANYSDGNFVITAATPISVGFLSDMTYTLFYR